MRFTALLAPAIISQMNSTSTITGSVKVARVADERDRVAGRGLAAVVLEPRREREPAEDDRDEGLADDLRLAAQAEAALLGDLDVVVEEADGAEPDEQEQQQQRRGADGSLPVMQLGEEVGRAPTASMITRPPIVGVPRLVWCVVGPSSRISWP